jgi:diphosphomevalonate decarboxylase
MYIIQLVTEYNRVKGDLSCAYSFDAGPNAVIFTPSTNARELMAIFNYYLPPGQDNSKYFYGLSDEPPNIPSKGIIDGISLSPWQPGALHYIIHTRVGPGPRQLTSTDDHLLDDEGMPHHINM